MSTRATYEFREEYASQPQGEPETEAHTVYKHCDGYPEGGLQAIALALPHAWPLPRFEADDFAAAFVSGNRLRPGDVRLTHGRDAHGDTEYHYVVTQREGQIHVKAFEKAAPWKLLDEGSLIDLLRKYVPEPCEEVRALMTNITLGS